MANRVLRNTRQRQMRTFHPILAATAASSTLPLLFDLGNLHPFIVISRPSQSVRTPYVADLIAATEEVKLISRTHLMERSTSCKSQKDKLVALKSLSTILRDLSSTSKECNIVLGHTPSLDCAGMILPGSTVYCTENPSMTSKTAFSVQLCEELRDNDSTYVTVGCHPALAERAAKWLLELQLLPELGPYNLSDIHTQQTYGRSRVDFTLSSVDGTSITLLEVKNCVGADYCDGLVPAGRSDVGVYTVPAEDYQQHAIFPHGQKKPGVGVVSDRAIKHIHELTNLHGTIDSTARSGKRISAAILFVVNRSDCVAFRPCHEACLLFAQVLHRAQLKGVRLIAKELVWREGKCYAGRSLPVVFDKSVRASEIDESFLHKVLEFNEDGSGRSRVPSPSKRLIGKRSSSASVKKPSPISKGSSARKDRRKRKATS
jgi:DNA-binding sugar fermentation-stimulating protein